jgi:hypothetical protein
MKASAKHAKGEARAAILERLAVIDAELLDFARGNLDERTRAQLLAKAEADIAPFVARMSADARAAAVDAAFRRHVRDSAALPVLAVLE